jgi:serine O-acetyltransferase
VKLTLTSADLAVYLARQMETFFPDGQVKSDALQPHLNRALERVEHCFFHIRRRYYHTDGVTHFDHLHTDQYAAFLYFFGNTVHRDAGDPTLAAKSYALNKALHGLDLYYAVAMPDIFYFMHPVGTVIGRGTFEDFLCVYQNCSIGADLEAQIHPRFGRGVTMFAGSRVIGDCRVGSNCLIAAGTLVLNKDLPDDTVSFGQHPNVQSRPTQHDVVEDVFLFREKVDAR